MTMTDVPKDFSDALKEAGLAGFFSECTASHRREYLKWIGEAKKSETRKKRIEQALQKISSKCAEEIQRSRKKN